jgi:regulation of enolase protein 1 (concanavalin A-like superfamily)
LTSSSSSTPAAPSNLTGTRASSSQVNLSWTDNSTNETGFKIERSTDGTNFTQIATVASNVTTYSDTAATNVTTYYRVRATNSAGDSSYSNVAQISPLGTLAAPSNLTASATSATKVALKWTNNATNATGVKIERSTDNVNFTQIATVASNVASYNDTALTSGRTYYYRVRATSSTGDSAYSNIASATPQNTALPSPWTQGDVGSVGLPGSAIYSSGVYTVQGSGSNIWGKADSFHYVYQSLKGDGQIIARVVGVGNTDPGAKAGVMIRETLAAGSKQATVDVTSANGVEFLRRTTDKGNNITTATTASGAAPYWVKLVRQGSTFSGYVSTDGVTWKLLGTASISMAQTVYIGLAVTSHNNSALNTSAFDNVKVG